MARAPPGSGDARVTVLQLLPFPRDGTVDGTELRVQPRVGLAQQRVGGYSLGVLEGTGSGAAACHSSRIV